MYLQLWHALSHTHLKLPWETEHNMLLIWLTCWSACWSHEHWLHISIHLDLSRAFWCQQPSNHLLSTSLYLFFGPWNGCVQGSHASKQIQGIRWLDIWATWPKHSKRLFVSLVLILSKSPHISHCTWWDSLFPLLLVSNAQNKPHTPTVWRKLFNFLSCLHRGVQHLLPYYKTDRTQTLYTSFLISIE